MSSTSSASSVTSETWDDWTEPPAPVQALFSAQIFDTPELALQHDKTIHGVDVALLASTLDFFERIRLINFIRATKPAPESLKRLDRNAAWLSDDQYLIPVLEDDPLLQYDFDVYPTSTGGQVKVETATMSDIETALRAQLSDANEAITLLKSMVANQMGDALVPAEGEVVEKGKAKDEEERDDDSHYFESYAYNEIHEIMLKDKIRTNAYRDFILSNPAVFKDAVVLDVGCGSGILSMFAAKAGAKKVYAVDASAVAFKAERNIKANGLSDVITVIKGKIEEIVIPEKVDVIVSEWMGYFLLYECMLDSVLYAREKYLKPTGLMVPSQCTILLSLFDGSAMVKDRIDFWDDVYGYKMEAMREEIYEEAMIEVVNTSDVVSDEIALIDVVTQTVTVPQLSFKTLFGLHATKSTTVHAFLGHFDTFFTTDGRLASAEEGAAAMVEGEVFFTTGPRGTPTHWKQTVFLLKEPLAVVEGDVVAGTFSCVKNPENSRELIVEMTWSVKGAEGKEGEMKAQVWKVR